MRPENYANSRLRKALREAGPSEEQIHDVRVDLRKYWAVAEALRPLYYDPECATLVKSLLRRLGRIRDYDVVGCVNIVRDREVSWVLSRLPRLKECELPRVYGSRLMVYERLAKIYSGLHAKMGFHDFRKKVRVSYYLLESVGEDLSEKLKAISRELGDLRDKYLRERCALDAEIPYDEGLVKEVRLLIKEAIAKSEFDHLKALLERTSATS